MNRLLKRREKGNKWRSNIPTNIVKRLNKEKEKSRKCQIVVAGDDEFQVQEDNSHFIVNLSRRTSECQVWDLSGIPCMHALVGITYRRGNIEDFIDNTLSKQQYKKTYNHHIHPVLHSDMWPEGLHVTPEHLLPPTYRRPPGRPKKNIRKEANERESSKMSTVVRCKRCKQLEHNIRTCKGTPRSSTVVENVQTQSQFEGSSNLEVEIPLSQSAESTRNGKRKTTQSGSNPRRKGHKATVQDEGPSVQAEATAKISKAAPSSLKAAPSSSNAASKSSSLPASEYASKPVFKPVSKPSSQPAPS